MSSPELSIVVPFYNEEEGCEQVLHCLIETLDLHLVDYELIPVNNGSHDQTGSILDRCARTCPRINVVTVQQNQGYGWGILSGLAQSTGQFVGYVDGDTQVPPVEVVNIFKHAAAHDIDICKGTRINRGDGFRRYLISMVYNILFKVLFRCSIQDVNAKPKIMKRACYTELNLQSKDWFIDAEMILKGQSLGMRIEEIPIEFLSRTQGASKVRMGAIFEFIKNLLIYRLNSGK